MPVLVGVTIIAVEDSTIASYKLVALQSDLPFCGLRGCTEKHRVEMYRGPGDKTYFVRADGDILLGAAVLEVGEELTYKGL